MRSSTLVAAFWLILAPLSAHASAYSLGNHGGVFGFDSGPGESNFLSVNKWNYDGVTATQLDSGIQNSSIDPPCAEYDAGNCVAHYAAGVARFANEIDLSAGFLRVSAAAGGAYASVRSGADMEDILTFSLPEGLPSATITASMVLGGAGTDCQRLTGGRTLALSDARGSISVVDYGPACSIDFLGQTFTVQRSVVNGGSLTIFANLYARLVHLGESDWNSSYAVDIPAQIALSMPAGVTFTSASGVFLTTPAPPTLLLLGTACVGLSRWASKRRVLNTGR